MPSQKIDIIKLTEEISNTFNQDELKALSFGLGILDFNKIKGKTRSDTARELVAYFQRRGRLKELITALKEERSNVDWPQLDINEKNEGEKSDENHESINSQNDGDEGQAQVPVSPKNRFPLGSAASASAIWNNPAALRKILIVFVILSVVFLLLFVNSAINFIDNEFLITDQNQELMEEVDLNESNSDNVAILTDTERAETPTLILTDTSELPPTSPFTPTIAIENPPAEVDASTPTLVVNISPTEMPTSVTSTATQTLTAQGGEAEIPKATISPTSTLILTSTITITPTPQPLPTSTPWPLPTITPIPPTITSLQVLPGDVLEVIWEWSEILGADQFYAVRLWPANSSDPGVRNSLVWQKETLYRVQVDNDRFPEGDYLLNVAVVFKEGGASQNVVQSATLSINIPKVIPTPNVPDP